MRNSVILRLLEPSDMPSVEELHRQQGEMLGAEMDMPPLQVDETVPLALVAERDGKVIGCLYLERVLEAGYIGTDPAGLAKVLESRNHLKYFAKHTGARVTRVFVAKQVDEKLEKKLTRKRVGFKKLDEQYRHYAIVL